MKDSLIYHDDEFGGAYIDISIDNYNKIKDWQRQSCAFFLAEKWGFEPQRDLHHLSVFKTDPFNHLGISPCAY